MKYLLILAVIVTLPCCETSTTTNPDGSTTVTRSPHMPSLTLGAGLAGSVLDRTPSK